MSTYEAKNLCQNLLVVPPNKEKYMKESEKIHELLLKITYRIEFIALDEGYIDISDVIPIYCKSQSSQNMWNFNFPFHIFTMNRFYFSLITSICSFRMFIWFISKILSHFSFKHFLNSSPSKSFKASLSLVVLMSFLLIKTVIIFLSIKNSLL